MQGWKASVCVWGGCALGQVVMAFWPHSPIHSFCILKDPTWAMNGPLVRLLLGKQPSIQPTSGHGRGGVSQASPGDTAAFLREQDSA